METKISQGYGGRLELLRQDLKLSVEKFAEFAEIKGSSMSYILREETKNPGINVFVNISKKTGVNLIWLATGEGEMRELSPNLASKPADGGAFGGKVVEQMESRIEELKDQVDNLKYIVNLQRQMLEQSNSAAVSVGKPEGAILRPLSTPLSFEETMRQYRQTVMGQMPKSSLFLVPSVAKSVAPRSFE